MLSSWFSYKSIDEAQAEILRVAENLIEYVFVNVEDSLGHVLAEDVISPRDIPPFDVAHFDGYAVRSEDTSHANHERPCKLTVVGEMGLLDRPEKLRISKGKAAKIVTGSPLPEGANAVAPREQVRKGNGYILLVRPMPEGYHVIPRGSDIRKGEVILRRGMRIAGKEAKVMMDLGVEKVKVYRRPKVYIMPIGSEFVEGNKRETHSFLISYMVERNGGEAVRIPPIKDDPDEIGDAMRSAIEKADVLVTIGGLSMGPWDYVWAQATKIGKPMIRGIRAHPGRVTSVALSMKPIIMLPGLIQSTISGSIFILLPLIRRISGLSPSPLYLKGEFELKDDVELLAYRSFKRPKLAKVREEGVELFKYESIEEGVLLKADGLVIVEEHVERLKKGEKVKVWGVQGLFEHG